MAKKDCGYPEGSYQKPYTTLLEHDVFPYIGILPINMLGPRDVLNKALRKIEARGSIDTAHRAKQICGRIFRYAVAVGLAEPIVGVLK